MAVSDGNPVNYLDVNGNWQEIDTVINSNIANPEYENGVEKNSFQTYFKKIPAGFLPVIIANTSFNFVW